MEIETQTVSTFPPQPESNHNHPFPYPLPMGLTSSSELKDGRNSETAATVSPDSADAAVSNHKTGAPLEMPLHADSGLKEVDSDQQESDCAAVKLQKAYRGYRTRRKLADSAVVAEELWWQAIDYARLSHSTVSFFDFSKRETPASRWNRVSLNASKVGKGLSKDAKAQKLAFQHWIEAIDPRHRYGHSLHIYYVEWCKADAGQPFFYWLDLGDGKDLDLKECPRSKLRHQCIKYLGPKEREDYEYIVVEGKILHKQTGEFLHTMKGTEVVKWIFVMSPSNKFYVGEKKKGGFHHSSFLAGGATEAAGRLVADHGVLKSISAYSGHYRPTDERLDNFLSFLSQNGVNLNEVEIQRASADTDTYEENTQVAAIEAPAAEPPTEETEVKEAITSSEQPEVTDPETKGTYQRTLSGGLQSPRADVPKKAILHRINSKKAVKSYQLGNQLSLKWSTGAGPRIGCVADYPAELRQQALEFVNLSPRSPPTPSSRVWSNSPKTPRSSQLYNGMGNHSSY